MTKCLPAPADQQEMEQHDPAVDAWDFRRQGFDYLNIAEQMELSEKAVRDLVFEYAKRTMATDDDPETLRRLDMGRIELALSSIMQSAAERGHRSYQADAHVDGEAG
jgi:hypothetical protein